MLELKWALPNPAEETIGRQGKRIVELEEEVARLKYSNDGFANLCHDMERELAALKAAAGPVAKAWNSARPWIVSSRGFVSLHRSSSEAENIAYGKLDELARLCGEG